MKLRVMDLETTGFDPTDHVVEIAAMDLILTDDGALKEVDGPWSSLVKPPVQIPATASAVHHLIDADVEHSPAWADVAPRFVGENIDVYVAHRAQFEQQWLTPELLGAKPWICTWKCSLRLWPDAPTHGNQGLRYWLNLPGLDRMLQAHRAEADVLVTAKLLARMLWPPAGEKVVTIDMMSKVSALPAVLPTFLFGKHYGKKFTEVPLDYLDWIVKQTDMDADVIFTARLALRQRRPQ